MRGLPFDHVDGDLLACAVRERAREELARRADRGERFAQLVAEERKEFGLALVGLAQLLLAFAELAIGSLDLPARVDRVFEQIQRSAALIDGAEGFDALVSRGGKSSQTLEEAQILRIELALSIVRDHPDRANRLASDMEGNEKAFFGERGCRGEIGVAALPVTEEKRLVTIEHVAARPETAGCPAAPMRRPRPGDRRPVEAPALGSEQTQA